MNNWTKLGYILVGAGLGVFAATLFYERELDKPIGDIEEYVPKEFEETDEDSDISSASDKGVEATSAFSNSDAQILDYYKSKEDSTERHADTQARREEFEERRANRNQATRYSRMYEDGESVEAKLQAQRNASEEYARKLEAGYSFDDYLNDITSTDDSPNDDDVFENETLEKSDLVTERIEENIEVYLGENPQDFVSLVFYEGDNTLADDREHIVPAADEVVGLAAISRLIEGGPGADDGTIYIRNLKTHINYEIVLDAGSYSETVLGIHLRRRNEGAGGDVDRKR